MNKIYIIAEAGVNHNGSLKTAKELINKAAFAGADAVKFQTFRADTIVSIHAPKADYQKKLTGLNESQYQMLKKLELSYDNHLELKKHCQKMKIDFLSSAFDIDGVKFLKRLKLKFIKVPSGEITNLPYLEAVGGLNGKVLLSTGMSELVEIADAVEVLVKNGTKRSNITLLQCNTDYPAPFEDANLRVLNTLAQRFKLPVGYSDHTVGIEASIAAAALGATVIEKHFTLDRAMPGPDHKASIEPAELKLLVKSVRNIEAALGSGIKKPTKSELRNIKAARKSIVAAVPVMKNELFTEQNIAVKRPGTGISPMLWHKILGKRANKNFGKDELITL
ncbi:MAG: N-acetylneuraminate synthase [Elusimicrobia bacterium RIFOXYA1_FULL_47_7]|nr:MAG: N-acetylneuraminate synthase [Elusimicrobia bacterium RIFOXYA12_FULL_49_49]OGS09692.1 MAG: N-acetylneuraminate synthase [Elusimicrobia bacterium RIFOXYA1_FULL_47_7]OGS16791.1 MAG: N-acetylneuraminate synthase [Elusimicrobia bacterium RIFOXYA2_FULL_47_53]OGS32019.1 MAG: N-acetylneuraminate synthase [Elusimicrobia bacterium RIFOXYB2_FULL_46_23]